MEPTMSWTRIAKTLAALALAAPLFAACAHSSPPDLSGGDPGSKPQDDGQSICLLHNCDNDADLCGGPGHEAHACSAHKCSQCSATFACPAGQTCSPQGVCESKCGTDGKGTCNGDGDCGGCGASASECHKPINSSGKCGP